MQFAFGAGTLFGVRTDVANSTPVEFAALQEGSVEFSASTKEAKGGYQFPLAVARGTGKISCKSKMVTINGRIFSDLFFGVAQTVGQLMEAYHEAAVAIPTTPFTITGANGATWVDDLGAVYGPLLSDGTACSLSGQPFTKVGSAATPIAGQYKVAAGGIYTFSSADNVSKYMAAISYTYTYAAAGNRIVVANQLLGVNPVFTAVLNVPYTGPSGQLNLLIKLHACVAEKLTFATKLEDFIIPEFDFACFADSSNNLATISFVN